MGQVQQGAGKRIQLQIMGSRGDIKVYQQEDLVEGLMAIQANRGSCLGHGLVLIEGEEYALRVETTYATPQWLEQSIPGIIERMLADSQT